MDNVGGGDGKWENGQKNKNKCDDYYGESDYGLIISV